MSFREKSAWISFIVILGVFGFYFWDLAAHLLGSGYPHRNYGAVFLLLVVAVVVLEVVLRVLVSIRSPLDARAPRDERDRLINLRAARIAFYVLMVGAFASIASIHAGATAGLMANCMLFAIWIAELSRLGSQVVLYRRSA